MVVLIIIIIIIVTVVRIIIIIIMVVLIIIIIRWRHSVLAQVVGLSALKLWLRSEVQFSIVSLRI